MPAIRGNLLEVKLGDNKCETVEIEEKMWRDWLGGRGLGTRLLMDWTEKGTDPLSEDAPMFLMTSPLMGTLTPGTNKIAAVFKSPLNGAVFVSLCGGHLGPTLRYAGWDGIALKGKSEKPVMLVIEDDRVELRDASGLWGKTVGETSDLIRDNWKGREAQWALIGPGGENGVKFASIHSHRGREFGRGGGGLVMGSKGLKAIIVVGTGGVPIHDRVEVEKLAVAAWKRISENAKAQVRKRWGTLELVATINELGFWPTRNFSEGYFPDGDKIDATAYEKTVLIGHRSCHSCPIACGKIGKFRTPDGTEFELEGPEFESLSLLGPNLGFGDFDTIAYATNLCDELGVDTISMGNAVGVVMEAAEKGLLPAGLVDDMDIGFSKPEAAFELIRKCAYAEGEIGKLLGLNTTELACELGAPDLAMAVKGLGLPAYDPRGIKGLGLNYATAAEGASHMRGPTMGPEIGGGKRLEDEEKSAMVIDCQVSMALVDSIGMCSTVRTGMSPDDMADFTKAVTGFETSGDDLLKIGKRIIDLEKRYNLREGFTRKDDTLPKRFTEQPMPGGNSKGACIDIDAMLDDYYKAMGWDENGVPPRGDTF